MPGKASLNILWWSKMIICKYATISLGNDGEHIISTISFSIIKVSQAKNPVRILCPTYTGSKRKRFQFFAAFCLRLKSLQTANNLVSMGWWICVVSETNYERDSTSGMFWDRKFGWNEHGKYVARWQGRTVLLTLRWGEKAKSLAQDLSGKQQTYINGVMNGYSKWD